MLELLDCSFKFFSNILGCTRDINNFCTSLLITQIKKNLKIKEISNLSHILLRLNISMRCNK